MPIDDGLIGGIHVSRFARAETATLQEDEHAAFQASTLDALLRGSLRGDLTIAELLAHGDLGLGTVDLLDGELIIVDGEAWVARADGRVERPDPATTTPFAVVCPFATEQAGALTQADGFAAVVAQIDALAPPRASCLAVRIAATVSYARLRSVPAQRQPNPTLADALAAQTIFEARMIAATIVGFRFPLDVEGIEEPGWHLHLIADDRSIGGHVLDLSVTNGHIEIEYEEALHVEFPAGVDPGPIGDNPERAAIIERAEHEGEGT